MTAEPENDPPLPEEAEEETQEQQGESLFAAPVMAEQERMIEAILFATADPVSVKELNARMPHGCDAAEALVHLRKRYEGRGVRLVKVGDDWAMRTAPDLGFLMQKETVETRKLSRAAACSAALPPVARKRGFSYSATIFLPIRRKARMRVSLFCAWSSPVSDEPIPVRSEAT